MRQYWILRGTIALAAAAVLISTTVVTAQDKSASGQPMTLTGCLISTPNPDPAGSVGKPPIYTMEVVAPSSATVQGASTTPTGTTPRTSAVKPTVYTLTAAESIGLAQHVNHLVEVIGHLPTLKPPSSAQAPPVAAGAKPPGQELKAGGAHNTFEVTALKMVSTSCKQPPGQ